MKNNYEETENMKRSKEIFFVPFANFVLNKQKKYGRIRKTEDKEKKKKRV